MSDFLKDFNDPERTTQAQQQVINQMTQEIAQLKITNQKLLALIHDADAKLTELEEAKKAKPSNKRPPKPTPVQH